MSLCRIFLEKESDFIEIDKKDSHHLINVLRLSVGDQFEIAFTKNCHLALAEIVEIKPTVKAKVLKSEKQEKRSYQSIMIFAVCKPARNELLVEKLTELGIDKIIMLNASRSVTKLTSSKIDRLYKIAYSAASQSKRMSLPQLDLVEFNNLDNVLSDFNLQQAFICSLENNRQNLAKAIGEGDTFVFVVGPEGDFTEEEYAYFQSKGFQSVGLNERVLRSETAAISAVSVLETMQFKQV